jgi:uncharacterized membrane protein YjgN (DUF898 family)
MNIGLPEVAPGDRVRFSGRALPFFGQQLWRLLLTIVTIGFHRFWWKTWQRRFLWANTAIDGDPLEYQGKGSELLIGALIAMVIFTIPYVVGFNLATMLMMRADMVSIAIGGALMLATVGAIMFLIGFAVHRAVRYRLSRTAWRGIRGGMHPRSWAYARLSFQWLLLQVVTLGLLTPRADAARWNALLGDATFGSLDVAPRLDAARLWPPFWASFGVATAGAVLLAALLLLPNIEALGWMFEEMADSEREDLSPEAGRAFLALFGFVTLLFPLFALAGLPYRAAFLREALGATAIGPVRLGFSARLMDWFLWVLGNVALVVFTLGLGTLVLLWRQWAFWMTHLTLEGAFDPEMLEQTRMEAPRQGEGLADAFDVGGF